MASIARDESLSAASARFQHADIARQQAIHRLLEIVNGNGIGQGERRHLRQRVDAGVGASGAIHVHRRAFDFRQHVFEDALNRWAARAAPASRDTPCRRS